MTARTTSHATFVIERQYPFPPAKVFAAWADPEAKRQWFACHDDWAPGKHELDFRAGGREHLRHALTTLPWEGLTLSEGDPAIPSTQLTAPPTARD